MNDYTSVLGGGPFELGLQVFQNLQGQYDTIGPGHGSGAPTCGWISAGEVVENGSSYTLW